MVKSDNPDAHLIFLLPSDFFEGSILRSRTSFCTFASRPNSSSVTSSSSPTPARSAPATRSSSPVGSPGRAIPTSSPSSATRLTSVNVEAAGILGKPQPVPYVAARDTSSSKDAASDEDEAEPDVDDISPRFLASTTFSNSFLWSAPGRAACSPLGSCVPRQPEDRPWDPPPPTP